MLPDTTLEIDIPFGDLGKHNGPKLPQETVKGRVTRLYFSSPTFSAGVLEKCDGKSIKFAGKLFLQENERVILTGRWADSKYGLQLEVSEMTYDQDLGVDGLANWLALNPDFKGLGPVKGRKVAEAFAHNFDAALTQTPDAVARVASISLDTVARIREVWQKNRTLNSAATLLAEYELTHLQITTLYDKYGTGVVSLLKSDPFVIIREIPGYGFKKLDKIARKLGMPKNHRGRIQAGVLWVVQNVIENGHTCIAWDDLSQETLELLVLDNLDAHERIDREINYLLDDGLISCVPDGETCLITTPGLKEAEEYLRLAFDHSRDVPNPHFRKTVDIPDALKGSQREAYCNALRNSLSVITGGAGSGKTFTVRAIAEHYQDRDLKVLLCAPTGKAAKRMEEMGCGRASTIHRLLAYDGTTGEFGFNAENKLQGDVLIVDEFSMVDTFLAHDLFRAVDHRRTAVLLVGDHNQLPPVGPGYVLRDIIDHDLLPVSRLTEVHRNAGALKKNSLALLQGQVKPTEKSPQGDWYLFSGYESPEDVRAFIMGMFEQVLGEKLGLNLLTDVQVLAPQKKGPLGVNVLNAEIQQYIQWSLYDNHIDQADPSKRLPIHRGDKVIQTRNNYWLGVMNGAIGVVEDITKKKMTVRFGQEVMDQGTSTPLVTIPRDSWKDVQLAYALTVHKCQGSEFPCVIAVVHRQHTYMHHRNLFYTAATRASEHLIVVGDSWGIKNCARKVQVEHRRTLLPVLSGAL